MKGAYAGFMGNMSPSQTEHLFGTKRKQLYRLYSGAYDGYIVRGRNSILPEPQWKRLKWNLARPICDISAGWAAGPRVKWRVKNDDALSAKADTIWKDSEGDSEFLIAALSASILGDMIVMAKTGDDGKSRIEFLDPHICYPEFDPHDYRKLLSLEIAYPAPDLLYRELWDVSGMTTYMDPQSAGMTVPHEYGMVPAAWIPNMGIKGQVFGDSDLHGCLDLIEEYDHASDKQGRIHDYHAAPTVVARGVNKKNAALEKGERTVWYIDQDPKLCDISFLEWKGTPPSGDAHIERLRAAICEVSETPAIAFGRVDHGFSHTTGVAVKVLYGPLEDKTRRKRALWEPKLESVMCMALQSSGVDCMEEDVEIVWAESAPYNEVETMQNLLALQTLGASQEIVLAKAGLSDGEVKDSVAASAKENALAPLVGSNQTNAGSPAPLKAPPVGIKPPGG